MTEETMGGAAASIASHWASKSIRGVSAASAGISGPQWARKRRIAASCAGSRVGGGSGIQRLSWNAPLLWARTSCDQAAIAAGSMSRQPQLPRPPALATAMARERAGRRRPWGREGWGGGGRSGRRRRRPGREGFRAWAGTSSWWQPHAPGGACGQGRGRVLLRQRGQALPVERDAMAGPVRRHRHAVLDAAAARRCSGRGRSRAPPGRSGLGRRRAGGPSCRARRGR